MLTAIEVNKVRVHERGVEVRVGPFWLVADTTARDTESLIEMDDATVSAHLEWGETGPRLYVFASSMRRDLFVALRSIDGVGAATALAIIAVGETHDILRAAAGLDHRYFCQVPGIGPKRAMSVIGGIERACGRVLPAPVRAPMRDYVAARDALTQRGLPEAAAEQLLGAVIDDAGSGATSLTAERMLTIIEETGGA